MWVTSSPATALTPTAVALGNFDGIHRGHQKVIQPILHESRMLSILDEPSQFENSDLSELLGGFSQPPDGGTDRIYATMATFHPHPREFFSGQAWKLLTPRLEKVQQLSLFGIEQLVLLPFDRELAALSPQQFVEKILVQQLQATHVSVGADFRFGHRRTGTSSDLKMLASAYGVNVTIVPLQTSQGERISSSLIRQSLEQGEIQKANRLLGRPYTLRGVVVKGQQLGRTIGFPTANLQLPPEKFLPQRGVYCVRVGNPALTSLASSHLGVMNIGERPTVNGTTLTVEVHLLDWSEDLYGQTLTVSLEKFLRPEQKFPSLDALKTQIQADCVAARAFFEQGN
ncbi:MAG TPA: bifunctional riboflavin kinase/FAD synthetase [Cyanobacteria bacterium UBA9273]|nr:bifunctional riboflavin kinase/FAD synthetase [Cyanobacteria bacterium UBA9273]